MKRTKVTSTVMALAFALVLGFAGIAGAQPHMMGYQNMSPEQYKVMQDMHVEFDKKAEPLRQQLYAKQAELNALYYQGTPQNDPKVQSLLKDIGDLDGKNPKAVIESWNTPQYSWSPDGKWLVYASRRAAL